MKIRKEQLNLENVVMHNQAFNAKVRATGSGPTAINPDFGMSPSDCAAGNSYSGVVRGKLFAKSSLSNRSLIFSMAGQTYSISLSGVGQNSGITTMDVEVTFELDFIGGSNTARQFIVTGMAKIISALSPPVKLQGIAEYQIKTFNATLGGAFFVQFSGGHPEDYFECHKWLMRRENINNPI